jgi:hypothetical protein
MTFVTTTVRTSTGGALRTAVVVLFFPAALGA